MFFRLAMTVYAPAHLEVDDAAYQRHLPDIAVTGGTPHALGNMDAVVSKHNRGVSCTRVHWIGISLAQLSRTGCNRGACSQI